MLGSDVWSGSSGAFIDKEGSFIKQTIKKGSFECQNISLIFHFCVTDTEIYHQTEATPLAIACFFGHIEVVKMLVHARANKNQASKVNIPYNVMYQGKYVLR